MDLDIMKLEPLKQMMYKWTINPSQDAANALFTVLNKSFNGEIDVMSHALDEIGHHIAIVSNGRYKLNYSVKPFEKDPEHKGFYEIFVKDNQTHSCIILFSRYESDMFIKLPTKELSFVELFEYVTKTSIEGNARKVMLAFTGPDRDMLAKAITVINSTAAKMKTSVVKRTAVEHNDLLNKLYEKSFALFNEYGCKLPLYEGQSLCEFVDIQMDETNRLLNQYLALAGMIDPGNRNPEIMQ